MKFVKIKKVRSPSRGTDQSAGIDFFVPEFDDEIKEKLKDFKFGSDEQGNYVVLKSLERILIPSGIKTYMKSGRMLMAANKSGVTSKKGLIVGACITDDTLIETNIGLVEARLLTKDFLLKNKNVKIKSFNEQKKEYEFKSFDGFRPTSVKDCLKLTFEDGTELVCSEDHFILTEEGWKMAKEL